MSLQALDERERPTKRHRLNRGGEGGDAAGLRCEDFDRRPGRGSTDGRDWKQTEQTESVPSTVESRMDPGKEKHE